MTTKQTTKARNAFENNMPTDKRFFKTQISKIIHSKLLLRVLLIKKAGPLMKLAVTLAKNILSLLGITGAASAIDAGIQKKIYSSETTILIISNKEIDDIMKIVLALGDSNILMKGITKAIKNEKTEQKRRFLEMSISTLGASMLANILTGKEILKDSYGIKKRKERLRTGYGSRRDF